MLNQPTLFGRIKEQYNDLVDDMLEQDQKFLVKRRNLVETGQVRLDLVQTEIKEMKSLAKEDWQHFIAASRKIQSQVVVKLHNNKNKKLPCNKTDAIQSNIREQIRSYKAAFESNSFRDQMNATIHRQLPSADNLIEYYQSRPQLKKFTLEQELHRIQYTLYTHDGKKVTEPNEIANYAKKYDTTQSSNRSSQETTDDEDHDLLWRAANQSILGDVISSLTSETGLVRPQLGSATAVDDCSIVIDFGRDKPSLRAECFLNISLPGAPDEGERISIAGVLISVHFCPSRRLFEAEILHVSPSPQFSEDEICTAAKSLLYL